MADSGLERAGRPDFGFNETLILLGLRGGSSSPGVATGVHEAERFRLAWSSNPESPGEPGNQEAVMAYFERMRDVIAGPFSEEIIRQRTVAGWQLVSLEWRRELPDSEMPGEGVFAEEIPFGLRISEDCKRLEVEPNENQALLQMMEMLVQDFPFSTVASDLNEKGFRTREGKRWNPVAIFNMIPRLIDVGPRLFSTEEWEKRREKFARMV